MKKIVLTVLLVIWMLVIFMFSNDSGDISSNRSDKFSKAIVEITNKDLSESKKQDLIRNMRFIVRKTAHFTLYFILGILVYFTLKSYNIDKNIIIYSILFCFIYSISDEIHQIYTPDRTFKIYDIFIDTIASTISINIMYLLRRKKI